MTYTNFDFEADLRQYDMWRFALDEGGGMLDAVNLNGPRDRNKLLPETTFGIFHGSPTWSRDNEVGYYLTTSTNNYVDTFGRLVQPGTTVSFSVSVWLKFGSTFGNFPCVVSEVQAGSLNGWGIEIFASTPNHGAPYAFGGDGTNNLNCYSASIPACQDNKWHLVVAVWDRINQTIRISVDVGTEFSTSISTLGSMNGDATAGLKIGENSNIGGTDGFAGSIHDLRIYRGRILYKQDMLRLYQNKKLKKLGPDLALPSWLYSQGAAAVSSSMLQTAVSIM